MEFSTIIGLIAASMTTIAFLPQAVRVWRLKETRDLSLSTFLLMTSGVLMWLFYGILTSDIPIIVANVITFSIAAVILGFKLKYG